MPSALSIWFFNDNEALGKAVFMAVGATLVAGVTLLSVQRLSRFGAGLAVAALGIVLATFLFVLWLVATIGS